MAQAQLRSSCAISGSQQTSSSGSNRAVCCMYAAVARHCLRTAVVCLTPWPCQQPICSHLVTGSTCVLLLLLLLCCCSHRTGVQLKDKWRNLVKFRHISADETQSLQPKTSGPWHKKYWAAAAAGKTG